MRKWRENAKTNEYKSAGVVVLFQPYEQVDHGDYVWLHVALVQQGVQHTGTDCRPRDKRRSEQILVLGHVFQSFLK